MSNEVLRDGRRCMLAFAGERGRPLLTPMAYWSDGASLWMATSASSVKARRLGPSGESPCAVYIPPLPADTPAGQNDTPVGAEGSGGVDTPTGSRGLVIDGSARVFTLDDPVGLVTHWPVISTALAALAVKNASSLTGYALDLPRTQLRWLPTNRVAIRVRMKRLRAVDEPTPGVGIAPALPGVVPSDIRRALSGQRKVVVAVDESGGMRIHPAVWGAGFTLDFGTAEVATGQRAVVVLDADEMGRPTAVMGLALHGTIEGQKLVPERATWWHGFDLSGAQIPSRPAGGIVLPD